MFTIRFTTVQYRPDALVTLRTSADGFQGDVAGLYDGDAWVFELDEQDVPSPLAFKFVLERRRWQSGPDLMVQPAPGADFVFGQPAVWFDPLLVEAESGQVARRFFEPNHDEGHVYDVVVVVGSGAGGGVLAAALAARGADVLVLEAGPYLFPTHVANLPRQLNAGAFEKHIWGLWDEFSQPTYVNVAGSEFGGRQSFNLGGRSVFWGGLIPELGEWELEGWPAPVRQYLRAGGGFAAANAYVSKVTAAADPYQQKVMGFLGQQLPGYTHRHAPVAVKAAGPVPGAIASGMFSTADLLLQHRLAGDERLTVNLNHLARKVEVAGGGPGRAVGVVCDDLLTGRQRFYRGNAIVLSAGTVESARLALASGLEDPNGLIGRGITDHTILYRHFSLPKTSPYWADDSSAKVWSRPTSEQRVRDVRFNLVLELGADMNQGRYVDDEHLKRHRQAKGDAMFCEVVYLFETPLGDENFVALTDPPGETVSVRVDRMPVPAAGLAEAEAVTTQLFGALGAEPITGEPLALQFAGLGAVAHEVGTLRMGGVVDADLRFLSYENLYACDNSVMPTSPAANPTLALIALALRLAQQLRP